MAKSTPATIDIRAANLLRLFPEVDEFAAKNPHFKREHNEYWNEASRVRWNKAFDMIDIQEGEKVQVTML